MSTISPMTMLWVPCSTSCVGRSTIAAQLSASRGGRPGSSSQSPTSNFESPLAPPPQRLHTSAWLSDNRLMPRSAPSEIAFQVAFERLTQTSIDGGFMLTSQKAVAAMA